MEQDHKVTLGSLEGGEDGRLVPEISSRGEFPNCLGPRPRMETG
jgi:hypothetical protein